MEQSKKEGGSAWRRTEAGRCDPYSSDTLCVEQRSPFCCSRPVLAWQKICAGFDLASGARER